MPNSNRRQGNPAAGPHHWRPRPLHETVADTVRRSILDGELEPGLRLVEDRLAEQFDVSRQPVREALRTLQLEGLVDISPRRGASVAQISPAQVGELVEVLAALDGLAARLAAGSDDPTTTSRIAAVLDEAGAILTRSGRELTPTDRECLAGLNRTFHVLVTQAAGNRPLTDTATPLRDRIQWIQAAVAQRRPERSWAEHGAILAAIRAGDADRAEVLARAHAAAASEAHDPHAPRTGT